MLILAVSLIGIFIIASLLTCKDVDDDYNGPDGCLMQPVLGGVN